MRRTSHAVAASSDAVGIQPDEGGSQPTLLLHLPEEDFSAPFFQIKPVGMTTAGRWFRQWHYLGRPGSGTHWGVFAPDLMAVVSLGPPNNVHGVAGRFDLSQWPGNVELNRVAVHPRCPTHTSRLVALVLRAACRDLAWVFSYADPDAGHHGGIYQALGAIYVGLSVPGGSQPFVIEGEVVHPRTVNARYGTRDPVRLNGMGVAFDRLAMPALKHTYILPLGRHRDAIRAHLERYRLPYPKRAAA